MNLYNELISLFEYPYPSSMIPPISRNESYDLFCFYNIFLALTAKQSPRGLLLLASKEIAKFKSSLCFVK